MQLLLLATTAAAATPAQPFSALLKPLPASVLAGLSSRGIEQPTPVQAASFERALSGESMVLHAETGSGKSLAFMLPALCRLQEPASPDSKLLVLSPTRELCSQLGDDLGALIRDGALDQAAKVGMVTPGHKARADELLGARVIVATPAELCQMLAPKEGAAAEAADGHGLADELARGVMTLVLDEVDALVPGKKDFRGKRHWKWMDKGMHPAEAVVKFLAKRSKREDLQVLAASATLDQSTRRKLNALLRPATAGGVSQGLSIVSSGDSDTAPAADADAPAAAEGGGGGDSGGAKMPERWTAVPSCIVHKTRGVDELGAAAAAAAVRALHAPAGDDEEDEAGGGLVFVSSRSTHLGGAHAVAKELTKLGLDATALTDALFPMSTRAIKRLPRAQQAEKARAKRAFAAAGDGGGAGEEGARRARLNAALRGGAPALLVADAAATRGLHFDAVGRVYILGLPANADTYLHLAGRTGRWPRPSRDEGDATVVTIATEDELRTLRGWSNGLGGVEFSSV